MSGVVKDQILAEELALGYVVAALTKLTLLSSPVTASSWPRPRARLRARPKNATRARQNDIWAWIFRT